MASVVINDGVVHVDGFEMVSSVWRDMAGAYAKHFNEAQERLEKIADIAREGGSTFDNAVRFSEIQEIAEKRFV